MDHLFRMQKEFERRIILEKLKACNWNERDTAAQFRIPISTLMRKMKRLKIEKQKDQN